MTDSALGAVLAGKYEIRRVIGRGGMGAVYEGRHLQIDKRIAVKVLDPEHAKSEELVARFRNEARAASRVESDHVVHVFDVGEDPNVGVFIVMEYLEGEDLADRLAREPVLDTLLALEIAWQAARGLAKAHAAGVVHRDLKPANVFLVARDGGPPAVKIVDFGISKLLSEELSREEGGLTRWGSAVGTPQYMSPEQAQGKPIDGRTDVWALGAVLYEMLAGKPAFPMLENYERTIFSIVLERPAPLGEVAPWVPSAVAALVGRAMEHGLDQRMPDCATFAQTIEALRRDGFGDEMAPGREVVPLSKPSSTRVARAVRSAALTTSGLAAHPASTSEPPEPKRRSRRAAIALMVTLLLAVGLGVGATALRANDRANGKALGASAHEPSLGESAATGSAGASSMTQTVTPTTTPSAAASSAASSSANVETIASGQPSTRASATTNPASAVRKSGGVKGAPTVAAPRTTEGQFGGVGVSQSY